MSYGTGQTASQRTITAFFDNRQDADEAIQRLVAEGVSRTSINIVEGSQGSAQESTAARSSAQEGMGFWDALKDLFLPDEDRSTYAEGLRRGGYLVTVRASDAQYERVIDILDDEGTVNLDEREASWRQEGWTGYGSASSRSSSGTGVGGAASDAASSVAGAAASAASATGSALSGSRSTDYDRTSTTSTTGTGASSSADRTAGDRETIPVTEERLNVGKREVGGGRVRVRSYVVEQPVEEQVNLRDESVSVERRPGDRPLTGTDKDNLFQERTIEAEEKSEEAVVNKEARVKEELVVNKDVNQRTETVSDTVRRTEVDVQDERGSRNPGSTSGTTDRKR